MKAIVIDDSRAMRGVLKRVLVSLSFDVYEACDGADALRKLTAGPGLKPELALVDWNMPVMNGLEFVKAIREDHAFDAMRIMMVTTEVDMERVAGALDSGANEYLMKPFTDECVREKLALLGFGSAEAAA